MTTPYFVGKYADKYSQYKLRRYKRTVLEIILSGSIPNKRHFYSVKMAPIEAEIYSWE
jgi:hypothetical protein